MKSDLEKQKELIVDAVLDLSKRLNALKYLLWKIKESEKPENKIAFDIYDEFLELFHRLLWDSVVVNISWLYDKNGERSLLWYLNQVKISQPSATATVDEKITELSNLSGMVKRIRKFRDKWIVHRDKDPFEHPEEFWRKEERPTIQEVELLVGTASKAIHDYFPVTDLTSHGTQKLFNVIDFIIEENPEILRKMKDFRLIENIDYSYLQTLVKDN